MQGDCHVRLRNITKLYGPVAVLNDVSFDVQPGEVHVLAGENGAGKSTLMKVLGGVVTDYTGDIELAGRMVRFRSPLDATRQGISVIHQELSLIPTMSVSDNLFLGDLPCRLGIVDKKRQYDLSVAALAKVGLKTSPTAFAGDLPIATQQLIEIAKALRHSSKVVVMDEPTSALNAQEAERLFALIAELKADGVGIVYISHKMNEIERLADRITVLRDGQLIATQPASEMPLDRLISLMVGEKGLRALSKVLEARAAEVVLEVSNFGPNQLSLTVHAGEVVGLAGLEGSGNSAVLLSIFGAAGRPNGSISVGGRCQSIRNPIDAIKSGLALLTSDRKASGLVLSMSVASNATLAVLKKISPGGWLSRAKEKQIATDAQSELAIRAASLDMEVGQLSGGNQQKVALAKWIETKAKVLMLDEPTRGIDVNAKREIYELIEKWKSAGMAILLITSELPELLSLSDRILVMHRGQIVKEFDRSEAEADLVLQAAMGVG